jgi:hypothetical protein
MSCQFAVVAAVALCCGCSGASDRVSEETSDWQVPGTPETDLGETGNHGLSEAAPASLAARLASDRFVVADQASLQLRFYDSKGGFIRGVGRQGAGPGEFRSLSWVGTLPNDSVVTFDFSLRLFSIFDAHGEFGRSVRLAALPDGRGWPVPVGVVPTGRILLLSSGRPQFPGNRRGIAIDSTHVLSFDLDSGVATDHGRFPLLQTYAPGTPNRLVSVVPLSPRGVIAPFRTGFVFGFGDRPLVFLHSLLGEPVRQLALPFDPPDAVTRTQFAAEVAARIEAALADWRPALRQLAQDVSPPEVLPLFDYVITTAEGNLWIRRFLRVNDRMAVWLIVDSAGTSRGHLVTPASFSPLDIQGSSVLATWRDENGVERAGVFPLIRRSGQSQATATSG